MKKNVMMRVASVMLVLVLMTSSVISGTFAKYTTQDSGSDMARVAKWGVELQVFGNLYGDSYGTDDKIVKDTDASITVQSKEYLNPAAKDVVAPGTKNAEGFEISLKGQPEVDGIITTTIKTQNIFLKAGTYGVMVRVDSTITEANFDEIKEATNNELYQFDSGSQSYVKVTAYAGNVAYYTLEDFVELGGDYYPVAYKLANNPAYNSFYSPIEATPYKNDTLDAVATAIKTSLAPEDVDVTDNTTNCVRTLTFTKKFETNTDLTSYDLDDLVLTWEWKYDWDACDKVGDAADDCCKADTILGNLMAGNLNVVVLEGDVYKAPTEYTHYCLDTQFSIDITVTQVD